VDYNSPGGGCARSSQDHTASLVVSWILAVFGIFISGLFGYYIYRLNVRLIGYNETKLHTGNYNDLT